MPYTQFMDVTFNPADYPGADMPAKQAAVIAKAAKLYGFYAGGQVVDPLSPSSQDTLAHPVVVFDGADSHVKASVSAAPVEVDGAFGTKAAMDADLDAAAGQKVNCWDPDGTKRGRYVKVGAPGAGNWALDGEIADWHWPDNNHPNMLLGLNAFGSWIDSAPPFELRGDQAIYPPPPDNDWRRARLTFTVRAVNMRKGPMVKLALHCQGDVPARTAALPQENVLGNFFVPNFFQKRQLLSDVLGFNEPDSWGLPDVREHVEDSGWVDWVVDFSPDDLDWQAMGGIDRDLASSPYYYGVCPIEELLSSLTGNIYWLAVYPKPQTDPAAYFDSAGNLPIQSYERLTYDALMLKRIRAEYWTD